jgi:hypothetical protein
MATANKDRDKESIAAKRRTRRLGKSDACSNISQIPNRPLATPPDRSDDPSSLNEPALYRSKNHLSTASEEKHNNVLALC